MADDRPRLISKETVDKFTCPPGKDRVFRWDAGRGALSGFGVAAFPSGRKFYVIQYRKDGRSRRVTLGEHGRLTHEEARAEAKRKLGDVARGIDPVAQRKAAAEVRTFGAMLDEFLRLHVEAKRGERTHADYAAVASRHIRPAIGSTKLSALSRADVARLHSKLAETPATANRALAIISSAWTWAAGRDEPGVKLEANPCRGLERYEEEGRERYLTTAELTRLGDALREAETVGLPWEIDEEKPGAKHAPKAESRRRKLDPYAVAAVRLLILTGARLREVLHARWDWVDIERGILHLPTSKTGKKPVYLSAAALAILTGLHRIEGNPYVLPGEKDDAPRSDLKKPWAALTKAAGLPGLRLHDLRHTFASAGAGASLGLPVIGKLLGHAQAATTMRYAHLDADPLRRAVETISSTLDAAMSGGKAGNVVPTERSA